MLTAKKMNINPAPLDLLTQQIECLQASIQKIWLKYSTEYEYAVLYYEYPYSEGTRLDRSAVGAILGQFDNLRVHEVHQAFAQIRHCFQEECKLTTHGGFFDGYLNTLYLMEAYILVAKASQMISRLKYLQPIIDSLLQLDVFIPEDIDQLIEKHRQTKGSIDLEYDGGLSFKELKKLSDSQRYIRHYQVLRHEYLKAKEFLKFIMTKYRLKRQIVEIRPWFKFFFPESEKTYELLSKQFNQLLRHPHIGPEPETLTELSALNAKEYQIQQVMIAIKQKIRRQEYADGVLSQYVPKPRDEPVLQEEILTPRVYSI